MRSINKDIRQLDTLIHATQFHIRKAQEVYDISALVALQNQYHNLINQRFVLLGLKELSEVHNEQ